MSGQPDVVVENTNETTVSSEATFFIEAEEVKKLISSLALESRDCINDSRPRVEGETSSELFGDAALAQLRSIFDKYLECSSLIDPYLEEIVTLLSKSAKETIHEIYNSRLDHQNDGKGDEKVNNDDCIPKLKRHLSAIYAISKVRGRKHIEKFLPHEACDVEPVLHVLRFMETYKEKNAFDIEARVWESVYTLLLWLGMLSLVPFDLNTIDSSLEVAPSKDTSEDGKNDEDMKEKTLITSMLATARKHLGDAGLTREAAASCLASLLSRPDLEEIELKNFVLFSNETLKGYLKSRDFSGIGGDDGVSIFLVMGVIQTLATIFKTGSRSNLMERHLRFVEMLWEQAILVAEKAAPNRDSSSLGSGGGVLLLRKLLVKLFARVGCSYLPPKVSSWRYQRGRRSLLENLESSRNESKGSGATPSAESSCIQSQESEIDVGLFHVPDQVEDSMSQLIQSLTDPATTVRWSAAKGIGRVTERLPAICADDVLDAILELCDDIENDNAWHGACLTLAELARRGLLLPKRLGEVVPIVIRAIHYDIPRGQHSVGSHVRDAACYTCWAFARAYAPSVLKPYVSDLSKCIVVASLFDREINCRRAASASFQECVGRQGADNFKHGISILTTADYFSLGNRVDAYTTVAHSIAEFDEYRLAIIDHLYEEKIFHWDSEIRSLASISLRGLVLMEPTYFIETVLPSLLSNAMHENLFVRHGAVIGIAEIVLALQNEEKGIAEFNGVSETLISSISGLFFAIEKARLYRGRGGEIMRAAVSRLIECMAKSRVPMTVKQQLGILDGLDTNLKHPNEVIQNAAAAALNALMRSYFPVGQNGPSERLQNRVVDKYIKAVKEDDNPAATRGYALALGHLPAKLVAPNKSVLDAVVDCLCYSSHPTTLIGGQGDAETRKNSIKSLVRLCETVGIGIPPDAQVATVALNKCQVMKVFQALFDAVEDYNTDRRGDVGSWSRIAAMNGMESLTYLAIKASNIPKINNRNGSQTSAFDEYLPNAPNLAGRMSFLEHDITTRVQNCLDKQMPYHGIAVPQISNEVYFDDELSTAVVSAMLKQLAEKLDAVRGQAGACLKRMLTNQEVSLPFVQSKALLIEALRLNDKFLHTSWANPESTFPLVMRAINIEAFFESILAGVIISVGGLTESVTKSSSKYFLEYMRALKKINATGKVAKIGHGMYYTITENNLRYFCSFFNEPFLIFSQSIFKFQPSSDFLTNTRKMEE